MMAPRRNPAASVAVGVALAALGAMPALAQSQVPARTIANRTIANGDSIVIDGRTFSITPGTSKNDLATPTGQLGARRLGAGVIIFRRGDGLHLHFPGFAHLVREGTGYRLIPEAWGHAL